MTEFFGRDLPEALEAGDLRVLYLLQGAVTFPIVVAVSGNLAVPDAEERGFENVEVSREHEFFEVIQEIGEEQVPDMVAVVIRVGGDDNFVEAQVFDVVFDAERHHQVVELLVLVHRCLVLAKDVQRNALKAEYGLGIDVTRGNH